MNGLITLFQILGLCSYVFANILRKTFKVHLKGQSGPQVKNKFDAGLTSNPHCKKKKKLLVQQSAALTNPPLHLCVLYHKVMLIETIRLLLSYFSLPYFHE